MPDNDGRKISDDLKRKIDEIKRKALQEESKRIEEEAEKRGKEIAKLRFDKDEKLFQDQIQAAERDRQNAEKALRKQQEEIDRKLEEEKRKKREVQEREEEERRRKEEEERKRQKEEERIRQEKERLQREEEARQKAEEERRRLEEEARLKAEGERHRKEEELRRAEEERLRKEEEERQKKEREKIKLEEEIRRKEEERRLMEEEKKEHIRSLLANAQVFFNNHEYENALVEVAKALVNDPSNPIALELEQQIKQTKEALVKEKEVKKSKKKEAVPLKEREEAKPKKRILTLPAIIALSVVALVVIVIVISQLRKSALAEKVYLAVAPWQSSSNKIEESIIGSSLAEEVASRFESFSQTAVMGYASAFGINQNVKNADQEIYRLGYQYILKGKIGQSEKGFSIELKLVDSLGTTAWSKSYEKDASGLDSLANEIVVQVLEGLKLQFENKPSDILSHHGIASPDAYNFYLRGLEMLHRRTKESTQNALELFRGAINQDGKFAEAYAMAALVQGMRIDRGWDSGDSVLAGADKYAETAVQTNPDLAEGYLALGKILMLRREYDDAWQKFEVASKLSPNNSAVLLAKGKLLLIFGKEKEAIETLKSACDLNPRDPDILSMNAFACQLAGNVRDGFSYHETALRFVSDSIDYLIGPYGNSVLYSPELSLRYSGKVAAACELRLQSNPNDYKTLYRLGRMLQVNGKIIEAISILNKSENILRKELQMHPKNLDAKMNLTLTLTRLGKYPEANNLIQAFTEPEKKNAEVKYRVAQIYSLQMYSQKKKEVDPKKKAEAIKALRDAVLTNYSFEELTSADFYNLYNQPEFKTNIALTKR